MKKLDNELPKLELPQPTQEQIDKFAAAWADAWYAALGAEDRPNALTKAKEYLSKFNKELVDSNNARGDQNQSEE